MQSINDGSSNIQPNPNTIKEGPLHKELLPELHEKIMSYLNNEDTSTLSLITSKLNEKTIRVIKNQEFLKMASFGRSLAEKLPDTHKAQKEALSHLITSDEYKASLDFDKMKEKLDTVKAQIKEILLTIPQKDLANLFDAFKGPKPKLYFDFVPLSVKHEKLHKELVGGSLRFTNIAFKEKLQEGAYANEEVFSPIINFKKDSKIEILSEFGFKPSVSDLNNAIKHFYKNINSMYEDLPLVDFKSRESFMNRLDKKRDIQEEENKANNTIITILEAGTKPSKETLELAEKLDVDMTIFDKYVV